MALFEAFPNYIWNLSVAIAMESGGQIGEIVDMCRPLKDAADSGADAGTPQFVKQWAAMGDKLLELAAEDEAKGRAFSASNKMERASLYLFTAERMQGHGAPGREETYARARESFDRSTHLGKLNRERVEIPLERGTMPALWTRAPGEGRKGAVVFCNGLDSCKELLYWTRLPQELARRGISTLCVDQPGSGEALRLQDLPVDPHSESWASRAVDWLETQPDVDPARIGMTGISLGGHFAPRTVAYEPRFASGAVWGANHNWREVQDKRMQREGENPVPHYWAHVMWAFGASDMDEFLAKSEAMNLNGHMDRIRVPFLVTHGANDRQISPRYANDLYEQLVNSPRREKVIFTDREGGVEHVGADNMAYGRDLISDWFAETLGRNNGMTFVAEARVPTAEARKYALQLGKHWSHNLKVEEDGDIRRITFPKDARGPDWAGALVRLAPEEGVLVCRIEASEPGQRDGLKGAVARHVDRFAFREAPLVYDWQDLQEERD